MLMLHVSLFTILNADLAHSWAGVYDMWQIAFLILTFTQLILGFAWYKISPKILQPCS